MFLLIRLIIIFVAVTCIQRSPLSSPVIEHFISIEHLLRSHLSYMASFYLHIIIYILYLQTVLKGHP
jgi:hypothetical protein